MLAAFGKCGTVVHAADSAGVSRSSHYKWLKEDPEYAAGFADAQEAAVEELERVAITRAKAGSDTLLIFLLKAARPEKYRERHTVEHTGSVLHKLAALTPAQLASIESMTDDELRAFLANA